MFVSLWKAVDVQGAYVINSLLSHSTRLMRTDKTLAHQCIGPTSRKSVNPSAGQTGCPLKAVVDIEAQDRGLKRQRHSGIQTVYSGDSPCPRCAAAGPVHCGVFTAPLLVSKGISSC